MDQFQEHIDQAIGEFATTAVAKHPYGQNIRTRLPTGGYASYHPRTLACLLRPYHRYSAFIRTAMAGGEAMDWKHLLAYITGTVDQELLLRNEYLVTENRILRHQITGRVPLRDGERKTLAEIGHKLGSRPCRTWPRSSSPTRFLAGTGNSWPRSLTALS